MKLLYILPLFWGVIHSFVINDVKPSTRHPACIDPTYACQDLLTARSCGVVKDCIHDIWATMGAPEDNNEICDICKEMVKEARDQLLSNETQEEIKEVFEGSCGLIPVKAIADECKKIFDALIPELIEMLASRMDPNMVCTVAGLCNNAALKKYNKNDQIMFAFNLLSTLGSNYCDDCKKIFTALKNILNSIPEEEMENLLSKVCNMFPDQAAQCNALISEYLPVVYVYVTTMEPDTACDTIGLCPESKSISKALVKYKDDLTCEFCESLVQYLRNIILTNTTKEEFRTALLNMCADLGSFADECKNLVNQYFDMIYDFIDQDLVPDKVCTALGLCQPNSTVVSPQVKVMPLVKLRNGKHPQRKTSVPLTKINPAKSAFPNSFPAVKVTPQVSAHENKYQNDETNKIDKTSVPQLPLERLMHPAVLFEQDKECAFCKAISFFLEKDIITRKEKNIQNALESVCEKWLPDYSKQCTVFVTNHYKTIMELLKHGIDFKEICDYLKVCPAEKPAPVKVTVIHPSNDAECEICKEVMQYLESVLKDNATEDEIRLALDKVCSVLPQSLSDQCQKFVKKYAKVVVSLLLQEFDPSRICEAINLCPEKLHLPIKDEIVCDVCKEVMQFLKQELQLPAVEDDIKKLLEKVCSILPKSLSDQCLNFIDEYTDLIITLIVQEIDPDVVCVSCGFCSGKPAKSIVTKPIRDTADCEICKEIMKIMEQELKDKNTEAAIRQALDEVCSLLPNQYAVRCQQIVDKYTDEIITFLVQNVKPDMICSLLQVCPTKDLECSLCQMVLHFMQEQLMDNSTQEEIKQALDKVCSYLPGSIADECTAFINEYGDAVLVLLAQKIDPSVICPLLNLCSLPKSVPALPVKSMKLSLCDVCTTTVDYIDKLLEDNSVDAEISQLVAKICILLPNPDAQNTCVSIINLYGPSILQMIGQLEDSKSVCQSLDLCPRKTGTVHLLGAEKCTFGPDYWCKSKAHAAACKAEDFCKQKVWKIRKYN